MLNRKKIGLVYSYDENWVGGAYYIQNLVHAINQLPDAEKPLLVLFSTDAHYDEFQKITGYPYLLKHADFHPKFSMAERAINKLSRIFLKKNIAGQGKLLSIKFPVFNIDEEDNGRPVNLHWIPDFQEHYLPMFFSKEEIDRRVSVQKKIAAKKDALLLLSSRAAYNDYKYLYPHALTQNFIVPFAVSHMPYQHLNINAIRATYKIKGGYFISANQFWAHKNHVVIIQAVKQLKDQGIDTCVIFTGKQHDWRNPDYFGSLVQLVKQYGLEESILFLGLIDRQDQLQLMHHAQAVIQPSKFEGWSTVIEDAKAMNQFVIASDIPVHAEQLPVNGVLFNPDKPDQLARIMKGIIEQPPVVVPIDYTETVRKYARDFLAVVP